MKIESFSIQNYKCIKDLAVDCRGADGEIKQWTVLLGENNTGKTNVLRALSYLVVSKFDFRAEIGEGREVVEEATGIIGILIQKSHVRREQFLVLVSFLMVSVVFRREWRSVSENLCLTKPYSRQTLACWIFKNGCCS